MNKKCYVLSSLVLLAAGYTYGSAAKSTAAIDQKKIDNTIELINAFYLHKKGLPLPNKTPLWIANSVASSHNRSCGLGIILDNWNYLPVDQQDVLIKKYSAPFIDGLKREYQEIQEAKEKLAQKIQEAREKLKQEKKGTQG